MAALRLVVVSMAFLLSAVPIKSQEVLVTVEQGVLRGETVTGVYGANYTRFLGIPFAEPPLGELRFQDPVPASAWDGVRDATVEGSSCVQGGQGAEDCLYLNVFVPVDGDPEGPMAVVFWVNGGGFVNESGSYHVNGPDFLMAYSVIMVSTNYRLGPLGFLSLENELVPGNAGLKDQTMAMQWVQSNIASFGGDPDRVMLVGESAASMAASLHLMSPMSAGLFSRIVMQSGTFITSMSEVRNASQIAFRLGAALGFETEDPQELLQFLQSVEAADLLVDDDLVMSEEEEWYIEFLPWAPTIEPVYDGAFMSESPIQILDEGRFTQVPIIIGVTSGELGLTALEDDELIDHLNEQFERSVGPCLHLPATQWQNAAALLLQDFYFGNDTVSAADPDPLCALFNDVSFLEPTDSMARKVVQLTDLPVYYYEFDYRGPNVFVTDCGVTHASDLDYLFVREKDTQNWDPDSEEDRVRRNFLRLWTNFAKYGNPTPEADPVIWQPYDEVNRSYLLMQANFTLESNKDAERMDFWNENIPLLPYPGTF